MWPDRVSNPGPLTYESGALPTAPRGLAHEVLVNRLGGLSLPRKSVVRLTDRLDMTLDVYRGRKTTIQQQQQQQQPLFPLCLAGTKVPLLRPFKSNTIKNPPKVMSVVMLFHGFSSCNTTRPGSCINPRFLPLFIVALCLLAHQQANCTTFRRNSHFNFII